MEQNKEEKKEKELKFGDFNMELCSRIELSPNEYNINKSNGKDMVLLVVYGALYNATNFHQRLISSFKQAKIEVSETELMSSHFVGWYKFPFMNLTFEKQAWDADKMAFKELEGKATLAFGSVQDYTYVGVVAIPKIALRMGSELMQSEGCNNRDWDAEYNHYCLMTNMWPLEPVPNDRRFTPSIAEATLTSSPLPIPAGGVLFFNATKWSLNQNPTRLLPSKEYLATIRAAHSRAVKQGYQLSATYVDKIKQLPFLPVEES